MENPIKNNEITPEICADLQSKTFEWNESIIAKGIKKFYFDQENNDLNHKQYLWYYLAEIIKDKETTSFNWCEIMEICIYLIEEIMIQEADNEIRSHLILHTLEHLVAYNNKYNTPLTKKEILDIFSSKIEIHGDPFRGFKK